MLARRRDRDLAANRIAVIAMNGAPSRNPGIHGASVQPSGRSAARLAKDEP